jgi:hypothetical protein
MLDFDWVKHLTLRMVTFHYAFESDLMWHVLSVVLLFSRLSYVCHITKWRDSKKSAIDFLFFTSDNLIIDFYYYIIKLYSSNITCSLLNSITRFKCIPILISYLKCSTSADVKWVWRVALVLKQKQTKMKKVLMT